MPYSARRELVRALLCVCLALACSVRAQPGGLPTPQPQAPLRHDIEAHVLVLEAQLDGHLLSDSMDAYADDGQILLPLTELARLLTLAIQFDTLRGIASGFVVREDRSFVLNVAESTATVGGRTQNFEPRLAQQIGDEVYVSQQLLSRWLPIDFETDMPTLQLRIRPRVKLPMQERLARESAAQALQRQRVPTGEGAYPLAMTQASWLGSPFIDQTFGVDARFGPSSSQYTTAYTAYLTGDVLGMEGSAYVSTALDPIDPDVRFTLSRHDPEGGLLGPLRARAVSLGHIHVPTVPGVMQSSPSGKGISLSNRPLSQPTSFDRHSIRGDLPPGWDVTLYYNDSLVAYQSSSSDGQYAFDDLPLSYGNNEFRLVFNGPLGQVRVERQSYLLDQSALKPGELHYSVAHQQSDQGEQRTVAQLDVGLTRHVMAHGGLVFKPQTGTGERVAYSQFGLRGYWDAVILSSQLTVGPDGGLMVEAGLKTRLGRYALELQHVQRNTEFDSDAFPRGPQALRSINTLRLNGALQWFNLPPLTLALEATHEQLESGQQHLGLSSRLSTQVRGTAVSNTLRWQHSDGASHADGSLQISRRVIGVGVNAQMDYSVSPSPQVQTYALSAAHNLTSGYRLSGGVLRTQTTGVTQWSAGLSKNLGRYALALSGSYSTQNELVLGLQMFMAMGKDPRTGQWLCDSQPMAGHGAASARVFVDRNGNGQLDAGEDLVKGAGFILNRGGRSPVRTNDQGTALIGRLPAGIYTDVAIDANTLEDPQWKPRVAGLRVLSRPGVAQMLDFPVVMTSEIEGTVYLVDKNQRRGIGDARIQLVNARGEIVATTTSAPDGYYLLHQVPPGDMRLRIAPEQVGKLKLGGVLVRSLKVPAEGDYLAGQDLELHTRGP